MNDLIEIALRLPKNEIERFIIDAKVSIEAIDSYNGVGLGQANQLLDIVLREDEKNLLFELLLGKEGWFCKIISDNKHKLRLIAYALGLTHNFFYYDFAVDSDIRELVKRISREEQLLLASCYLKQKLITYKSLINNTIKEVELYRGIRGNRDLEYYDTLNLESWTSDIDRARMFAGSKEGKGIVLYQKYKPEDIFVYKKSVYKGNSLPSHNPLASRNINRENEYIVENRERIIRLVEGLNCVRC
jgi:hypothetical protein